MTRRTAPHTHESRHVLAQEAARIMSEEAVRDFRVAKHKAAARLGFDTRHLPMPTNLEVEAALVERQRLFHAASQPASLRRLRETAREAMRMLNGFEARLVGPVLSGTADRHAIIYLHVFSDPPEQVAIFLMDKQIPYEVSARKLRFGAGVQRTYPMYRFLAGDTPVELTVFKVDGIREAPNSPVDGKPMKRGTLRDLDILLASTD